MKDQIQRQRRGNTSIYEEKSERYYWFAFFFLSIINLHTVAARSPNQDRNHFILNPLYRLNLTQSDSHFFSLLPQNIRF